MKNTAAMKLKQVPERYLIIGVDPHKKKHAAVVISDTGLQNLTHEHRTVIVELRDNYDRIMSKVISRGIESGDFAVKDVKVIVYLISSVIIRSTIWFSPKGRLSADKVSDIIFDFVYRGIKT